MTENKGVSFEITEKGWKKLDQVKSSSEGTVLSSLELGLLLAADSGVLERDDIRTKYGTLGVPIIKKFKKLGYIK